MSKEGSKSTTTSTIDDRCDRIVESIEGKNFGAISDPHKTFEVNVRRDDTEDDIKNISDALKRAVERHRARIFEKDGYAPAAQATFTFVKPNKSVHEFAKKGVIGEKSLRKILARYEERYKQPSVDFNLRSDDFGKMTHTGRIVAQELCALDIEKGRFDVVDGWIKLYPGVFRKRGELYLKLKKMITMSPDLIFSLLFGDKDKFSELTGDNNEMGIKAGDYVIIDNPRYGIYIFVFTEDRGEWVKGSDFDADVYPEGAVDRIGLVHGKTQIILKNNSVVWLAESYCCKIRP